jgi:hypothetical protein
MCALIPSRLAPQEVQHVRGTGGAPEIERPDTDGAADFIDISVQGLEELFDILFCVFAESNVLQSSLSCSEKSFSAKRLGRSGRVLTWAGKLSNRWGAVKREVGLKHTFMNVSVANSQGSISGAFSQIRFFITSI